MSCIQLHHLFWRWLCLTPSASKHLTQILFKLRHTSVKHRRKASPSVSYTLRLHLQPISPTMKRATRMLSFFLFFQPSILNFPPKSSKTKLLVSSQLRISLDDKSHSVLTVGNSHLPTYSHSTPVQPNVRPARRNEPPPPWWDRQGGFPSRMCLQRLGFGGISAPKLIYFYLTSMSLVRLLHLQR